MYQIKKLAFFLTIAFATSVLAESDTPSTIKSFQKNLNFKKYGKYGSPAFHLSKKTNDLFYANCNDTESNRTNYVCEVGRVTPVSNPDNFSTKTCNVSILNPDDFYYSRFMQALNHTHVLFVQRKTYMLDFSDNGFEQLRIYFLRMTDCHVVELTYGMTSIGKYYKLDVNTPEQTLDIVHTIESQRPMKETSDCERNFCKITFSLLDGKVARGLEEYLQIPRNVYYQTEEKHGAYHFLDSLDTVIYFENTDVHKYYRLHNGTATELFKLYKYSSSGCKQSVANSKFTCCDDNSAPNVTCKQYDAKDDDKLSLNLYLNLSDYSDKYWDLDNLVLYNPKDGGLVMVIIEFKGLYINNLRFLGFRSDGQRSSPVAIPYSNIDFKGDLRDNSLYVTEFLENDSEICFKIICWDGTDDNYTHARHRIECIPKSTLNIL